jgi:hypothetical protein
MAFYGQAKSDLAATRPRQESEAARQDQPGLVSEGTGDRAPIPARRNGGLLFPGIQELPAGLLAAPAGLGADPAVRHAGMPLALIAAALADGHAGLQQRPGEAGAVHRLACYDPHGGGADIDAVQAQPDAPDHLGHVLLAQVSGVVSFAGLGPVAERTVVRWAGMSGDGTQIPQFGAGCGRSARSAEHRKESGLRAGIGRDRHRWGEGAPALRKASSCGSMICWHACISSGSSA